MERRIAFVGGTLLDGSGSPPREDSAVIVEGRVIRSAETPVTPMDVDDVLDIDTRRLTITLGLIDCRSAWILGRSAHRGWRPSADITVLQQPERLLGVARDGRLLVDNGLRQRTASRLLI